MFRLQLSSKTSSLPDKGRVTLGARGESARTRSALSIFLFAFVYGSFIPTRDAVHSVLLGEALSEKYVSD